MCFLCIFLNILFVLLEIPIEVRGSPLWDISSLGAMDRSRLENDSAIAAVAVVVTLPLLGGGAPQFRSASGSQTFVVYKKLKTNCL